MRVKANSITCIVLRFPVFKRSKLHEHYCFAFVFILLLFYIISVLPHDARFLFQNLLLVQSMVKDKPFKMPLLRVSFQVYTYDARVLQNCCALDQV